MEFGAEGRQKDKADSYGLLLVGGEKRKLQVTIAGILKFRPKTT